MDDPAKFQRGVNVHDPSDQRVEEEEDQAASPFADPEDPKNVDPSKLF